jgi:kinetochore protein Nuf2
VACGLLCTIVFKTLDDMHHTKQYASPTLSIDDIISNFASWGFSISHEQLIRPSPDFTMSIYSICLSRVTEISQEALADASDAVMVSLDHPVGSFFLICLVQCVNAYPRSGTLWVEHQPCYISSPYVNSSSFISWCIKAQCFSRKRIARIAKIPDFNARDLSFPEPQRTRSHIAALINLIRFIEEYEPIVAAVRDRSAALVKDREKVSRDLADVHLKLSAIKFKSNLYLGYTPLVQ